MSLRREEVELEGAWISDGPAVVPDEVCARIQYLVENVLEQVAESPQRGAWEVLFRDPSDGRFWERSFPKGEMHGGGPPRLAVISPADAKTKYALGE